MKTEDLTAEQSLSLGDSLFVDDLFAEAVDAYAAALLVLREDTPTASALKIRILSHRSAAFYRLRRNEDALEDALEAMSIWSSEKEKGKGIAGLRPMESEVCHKRAGVAAMNLQDYKQAKELFEKAQQLATLNRGDEKTYQSYIRQCDYNLKPKASPSPMMDMGGMTAAAAPVSSPAPAPARVAVSKAATEKKSTASPATAAKPAAKKPKPAPTPPQSASTNSSSTTINNKKIPVTSVPKYQYYQNDKFVTVSLLESNVKAENLDVQFEVSHLTVRLTKAGITHTVICGNTYTDVNVEGCKINIKDEKVLIKLKKENVGFEWPELLGKKTFGSSSTSRPAAPAAAAEGESKQDEDGKEAKPAAPPVVPTIPAGKPRPYASHKDWDKIEKELADAEKEEKPEGDEAMNKLFQTIYASADEDTKRAMIKSYQTSGGTVLSTNWGEVKEKDVSTDVCNYAFHIALLCFDGDIIINFFLNFQIYFAPIVRVGAHRSQGHGMEKLRRRQTPHERRRLKKGGLVTFGTARSWL